MQSVQLNYVQNDPTKHIEINQHFIRQRGTLVAPWVYFMYGQNKTDGGCAYKRPQQQNFFIFSLQVRYE